MQKGEWEEWEDAKQMQMLKQRPGMLKKYHNLILGNTSRFKAVAMEFALKLAQ